MKLSSRRDFIKRTSQFAIGVPFLNNPINAASLFTDDDRLNINIFSKHLQFLDYRTTGEIAAEIGFSGVDLTVRRNGHVFPENVKTDLPKAIAEIRASGIDCKLATTAVKSADNPLDVAVLKALSDVKISHYRSNWFKFKKGEDMKESLLFFQKEIEKLGAVNKELNLVGCYQNHAGDGIGSSFWEIHKILETVDPNYFGVQYDIRHAMVEGAHSWKNGLQLLHPSIKTIVLKDYKWGRVNGKWQIINVPIGEGMVDFDQYFKLLKHYKLSPTTSLHLEYDLGGAEKGKRTLTVDKKIVFDAMKRDLDRVKKLWSQA
jgi:sugar phosphate isomerase/epimerase